MSNLHILKETVDTLGRDVYELRETHAQVLSQLQHKGSADPLLEQKLDRLNQSIDQTQDRLNRLEASSKRPLIGSSQETPFQPDQLNHKHAFMDYIRKGSEQDLISMEIKSMSGNVDKDGGYFIPHILSQEIHRILKEHCFLREISRVTSISHGSLELLVDKGDAAVGWAKETANRAETASPEIAKITIPVHEMYANPRITQRLLEDAAVNLEAWLTEKIASKMASLENQAFIQGDGADKPKGFLAYEMVEAAAWEWGKLECVKTGGNGTLGANPASAILNLFHSLKPVYLPGACWVMSRSAQSAVRNIKDTASGRYFWQHPAVAETRPTLLGYPVYVSDDMPALVTDTASNSIVFGNFREGYQIVDRQGIYALRDPFSAKPYVEFYTVKRVGGDVCNFEALKVLNCGE
ncbi:MAG: phage major capsid protein [Alphaproteobacteria bacterium]